MAEEADCWCARFERGEVWKMWDGERLEGGLTIGEDSICSDTRSLVVVWPTAGPSMVEDVYKCV
jgi:hypothetical protein